MELQDRLEELQDEGLGVVAISYDSEEILADFAQRRGITFPLLSDDDSQVITEFGILNTVATEGRGPNADDPDVIADVAKYVSVFGASRLIVGTPFPGTFMLDRNGRVSSRFFEEFYREQNTTANVMMKLGVGLSPIEAIRGTTAHLKLTAYPSNPSVTVGSRFSVAVEIEPNANMHLYAPGAEELGYRVISLNLTPRPHVRFEPVQFPESEIYYFEPLDERVPAHQEPFTLLQEVIVSGTEEAEAALAELDALTLSGTLDYQACDDKLCYEPVSLPLSFTLDLDQLDPVPIVRVEKTRCTGDSCRASPVHYVQRGPHDRIGIDPEVPVKILDVAGLAKIIHAKRSDADGLDGTQERQRVWVAVQHRHNR